MTVGGSVMVGENSLQTIVREAKEELNIDINQENLRLIRKFKTGNVWIDTYVLKYNYDISEIRFKEDEVSDAKWATWEEIDDLVKNGHFIIPKFLPAIPLFIGLQLKLRDYYFLGITLTRKSGTEQLKVGQLFWVNFSQVAIVQTSFFSVDGFICLCSIRINFSVSNTLIMTCSHQAGMETSDTRT